MAAKRIRARADRLRLWELVIGQQREILDEIPHLTQDLDDLTAMNEEMKALLAEQRVHLARYRETTKKIRDLGRRGDSIRSRIGATIRGRFGFAAVDLIRFGFQPLRKGVRAGKEEGETP